MKVLLDPARKDDRKRLSNDQPILRCGAGVDNDIVGLLGRRATAQMVRGDGAVVDPVGAEGRRPVATYGFSIVPDQRCAGPEDVADRVLDAGNRSHCGEQRGWDGMVLTAPDASRVARD